MAYRHLREVTGLNKRVEIRDKRTGTVYGGTTVAEVSVLLDGEQKYFAQRVKLDDDVTCEGDPTRYVIRIGYYTQRSDGPFCLGSQFAPILTPAELSVLVQGITENGWLIND
jgi:hypothetical protein